MSPSNLFTQLLEMASRAIFDPVSCFPAHSLLTNQPSTTKTSPARRISEYLEIVPIEGKGFGTIATKDICLHYPLYRVPRRHRPLPTPQRPPRIRLHRKSNAPYAPPPSALASTHCTKARALSRQGKCGSGKRMHSSSTPSRIATPSAPSSSICHGSTIPASRTRNTMRTSRKRGWSCTRPKALRKGRRSRFVTGRISCIRLARKGMRTCGMFTALAASAARVRTRGLGR